MSNLEKLGKILSYKATITEEGTLKTVTYKHEHGHSIKVLYRDGPTSPWKVIQKGRELI